MPYNFWVDVIRFLAERYDTKSNVKLGGFRSQLHASYVSSHTEELWYNETVCQWMTMYINGEMVDFGKAVKMIKISGKIKHLQRV